MKPLTSKTLRSDCGKAVLPPGRLRIFVADGHDLARKGLVALINSEPDLSVCGQTSAVNSVVTLLRQLRPDVVLIDVGAPREQSLSAIKAIRQKDGEVPIVGLSMLHRPDDVASVLSAGASELVLKAESGDGVLKAIRRARERRRRGTPERRDCMGGRGVDASGLTSIEQKIVALVGRGIPGAELAARLRLPRGTVEACLRNIRRKLHCVTAVQLVQFCIAAERRSRRSAPSA